MPKKKKKLVNYKIKDMCAKRGISVYELNKRLNVTKGYVGGLYARNRDTKISLMLRTAEILECSVHDIVELNK